MYFPTNTGNVADLSCRGDKRSDSDENCRRKWYREKKKGDRKSRGVKCKPKTRRDPCDLDGSDPDDDRNDKPDRKRSKALVAKRKTADGDPAEIEIPTRMVLMEICPLHYWNFQSNRVVEAIPSGMMENFAREVAGARSEDYFR